MEVNKCKCGKTPGMDRRVSGYDGRMQKHRVECGCGICGPWRSCETKAIDAWNARHRALRWTEYDGTEATLPEEEKEVVIISGYDTTGGCRVGQAWFDFQHEKWADIRVGHKWMFWPEGVE